MDKEFTAYKNALQARLDFKNKEVKMKLEDTKTRRDLIEARENLRIKEMELVEDSERVR